MENKRDALDKQIQTTNSLLDQARKDQRATQQELVLLDRQLGARQDLIGTLSAELRDVDRRIDEDQAVIEALKDDLVELKASYARMLQYAYRNRSSYDRLSYLFAAASFAQAFKRSRYLNQLAEQRRHQADRILETEAVLQEKVAGLKQQREEKNTLVLAQESERDRMAHDRGDRQHALDDLKKEEGRLRTTLNKQQKRRNDLDAAIRKAIEAEIAAQRKASGGSTGYTLTPEARELGADFEKNKGKLPWPVERGVITSHFGKQPHPVLKGITIENNGVDIATERNASVRSVFRGDVSSVIVIPGAGKAVVVNHGAYRSVYSNLREVTVSKGQHVDTKQPIGVVMTDDGSSTAHIEIWKITGDGLVKVDPGQWIFQDQ